MTVGQPTAVPILLYLSILWASLVLAQGSMIAPGREEFLAKLLGKGETLPAGCKLGEGGVDHTVVRVTYKCPNGDIVVELTHRSQGLLLSTHTGKFAVHVASGSPPPGLMDKLTELIRREEGAFEWSASGDEANSSSTTVAVLFAASLWVCWRYERLCTGPTKGARHTYAPSGRVWLLGVDSGGDPTPSI